MTMDTPPASILPRIDFEPDAPAAASQPDPSAGWELVPSTVRDETGTTLDEYEEAARNFQDQGEDELAVRARERVQQMRAWLALNIHRVHALN